MQSAPAPAVTVRLDPAIKAELTQVAGQNHRSVAAETRHALDVWLAVNRRPVKA